MRAVAREALMGIETRERRRKPFHAESNGIGLLADPKSRSLWVVAADILTASALFHKELLRIFEGKSKGKGRSSASRASTQVCVVRRRPVADESHLIAPVERLVRGVQAEGGELFQLFA